MVEMLDRPEQEMILVVDDTPDNLQLISELLIDRYRVKVANNGAKALRIAQGSPAPDLILLDIMMPEMDGYEVCRRLKADPQTRDIPLIFLTAKSEVADEQLGFDLGAADYITKPISPPIVLARVKAQLQLKAATDYLRDKSEYLELEVKRRTRDIQKLQDVTIEAMASLALMRDNPRSRHLQRIERYMTCLAKALARQQPALSGELDAERIAQLGRSAMLHVLGRLTLPDRVLLSHGEPNEADLRLLQEGVTAGRDALERAERKLGGSAGFLCDAKDIVYGQHERWDGKGYPQGLHGEQIPLSARLMALIGHFEELTCQHPYLPRISPAQAVTQIGAASGTRFDPMVVLAFVEATPQFIRIAESLADDAAAVGLELQRLEDSLAESIELTLPPAP
ncbi:response regulator [Pseudomonas sp. AOB-7]|jgi:putative two-component system response regulator|uniref:HD domain-containing phosphohydrolase n=1 Tax=unclassified Pseudomonas TaxID=196821 RepID=UPI000396D01B|nr:MULTISPECIES: HD domain-containing phosphohydrolase [unclassified Pseudomonas]ERI53878.1 chemotaxis protein CheY [Pseudomonas sp. EGD-AK9]RMH85365.1 response regulator [Pseudomonas sp. AOB-7]